MRELKVGRLKVRLARQSDIKRYIEIQKVEWKQSAVAENQARSRFKVNPAGILIAEDNRQMVGSITTIRINGYDFKNPKSWYEVTNNGLCTGHTSHGKVCFGVDLSVDTAQAPSGTLDALFVGCMQLVINMGVKYFILGGRMPTYRDSGGRRSPEEYLYARQSNGHYVDPQVDMYSRVPFMRIMGLAANYFKDPPSDNFGVILRWRNPFFGLPFKRVWANISCRLFEFYLKRQKAAFQKT